MTFPFHLDAANILPRDPGPWRGVDCVRFPDTHRRRQPRGASSNRCGRQIRLSAGIRLGFLLASSWILAGENTRTTPPAPRANVFPQSPTGKVSEPGFPPSFVPAEPPGNPDPSEADGELEEEDAGRSFFFKELVFSGFYSPVGLTGIPQTDPNRKHLELSPRPPGNYAGLEFVKTFTSASPINRTFLPEWLPLTAVDLHPRIVFDRLERGGGLDRLDFAPQDFWMRFNPAGLDRLSLRLGQFVIPYGVNPILAPRQQFILPLESEDLGLKWDWGIDLKGPIGRYDWEIASTIGSGEALHSTYPLQAPDRKSYLLTGRIGAPTYWNFQYGLSFLFGDLPVIRGSRIFSHDALSRWRLGLNSSYKLGTYLMLGAQATFGQDGFAGDERFVGITGGKTADVLGYRAWADWVVPQALDVRLRTQFESIVRDLSTSDSSDTALISELEYSLSNAITLRLDYRRELPRSQGDQRNALFLTFVYYAL